MIDDSWQGKATTRVYSASRFLVGETRAELRDFSSQLGSPSREAIFPRQLEDLLYVASLYPTLLYSTVFPVTLLYSITSPSFIYENNGIPETYKNVSWEQGVNLQRHGVFWRGVCGVPLQSQIRNPRGRALFRIWL